MFSKKTKQIDEIFTVDLTLCSKCQMDSEDFVNFHGLLRKYDLYLQVKVTTKKNNYLLCSRMYSPKSLKSLLCS